MVEASLGLFSRDVDNGPHINASNGQMDNIPAAGVPCTQDAAERKREREK